jgi:bifunctional UDP-N-acetylglucosamine pyrophosphorylase / glucosamine-1-phosphate N-acetyltransferase
MSGTELAVVILAAGQGIRMKSARPKVLHEVGRAPMLAHVLAVAKALGAARVVVVTAPGAEAVARLASAERAEIAVQDRQLGTAHAVLATQSVLGSFAGDLLILLGDAPLVRAATLRRLLASLNSADIAAIGFRAADPAGYGRMVVEDGRLIRIVEDSDASPAERQIDLCFSGTMAGRARTLLELLRGIGNRNAQGEFYLTDVVALARTAGLRLAAVEGDQDEMQGVNSRAQLAQAERVLQARWRRELMEAGVSMQAPDTVHLAADTKIAPDAAIGPYVVFGPGVTVGPGAEIRAFCHIENATIGPGAIVGPFARLRGGARLDAGTDIGNFVEIKNAHLEEGVKAHHLAYLGDSHVGARANIGAGTITCNYDGIAKHRTEIGAGAFIGSNAALVAPVAIGANAVVAAGSTITEDVEADALALGRARQVTKRGRAPGLRAAAQARKKKSS